MMYSIFYTSLQYSVSIIFLFSIFFFFNDTATTEIYTLSLHDALPILYMVKKIAQSMGGDVWFKSNENVGSTFFFWVPCRSEEHTSELQSRRDLVCRLLLEKKKKKITTLLNTT